MKTQRIILTAILLFSLTGLVHSQDVILKKDNTTILSKVLEINSSEIKYKKWSNQDGPTYSVSRSEVTSINYQNGEVERFTDNILPIQDNQQTNAIYPQAPTPTEKSQPNPEENKSSFSRKRVQFSLNGGIAFPMGEFGTTSNNEFSAPFSFGGDELETGCGAAKTGFNASLKLHIPVYKKGKDIIGIPLKFNLLYNGFTDAEKKCFRDQWQQIGSVMNEQYGSNAYQFQVTKYSNYMNYSFMGGVDYTHYFSKSFGLFAEANIGLNIAQITKSNMSNLLGGSLVYVDYDNYVRYYSGDGMEVSYKTKANIAYEIGGGFFLLDCLSIGFYYTGYSPFQVSPCWREYSSSYTFGGGNNEDIIEITAPKLKVSALSIQLGVHF